MTLAIPVRSLIMPNRPIVPVPVPFRTNFSQAVRRALDIAQHEHRIAAPVLAVASEHELAVQLRQQFLAQFAPKMTGLTGSSPMCFDDRSRYCN